MFRFTTITRELALACVLCAVQSTAHNTQAVLRYAATPPHNKLRHNLTECFHTDITLARFNCKLPDDGRKQKHVGAT
jgi:hypothetical protein